MKIFCKVTSDKWHVTSVGADLPCRVTRHPSPVTAFTMVEIAISLAVIGIALVGIIGVLPYGMRVQKDNREKTVINQDATVFLDAIRSGSRGLDDLTNYVFAITNSWTSFDATGKANKTGINGYDFLTATIAPNFFIPSGIFITPDKTLHYGTNIVGLLTTPEYIDNTGTAIPNVNFGGYSNHIVAYVRSLSGPATEKPPQTNEIMLDSAFSYKILCVNAPVAIDTNILYQYLWTPQPYIAGARVFLNWSFWLAASGGTLASDTPGISPRWTQTAFYDLELAANLHELRLTFLWPILPNGNVGTGRQTYRATVPGQIRQDTNNNSLYFFQSQSFTNAP